jgi:hypothetical protein
LLGFRICLRARLGKALITSLLYISVYILLNTIDMTLFYIIIFAIILFFIYFDYMSSIVRLSLYSNIGSQSSRPLISYVGGQHCISIVLRHCLPAEIPYIPSLVVDREVALECKYDTFVESFVVHFSNIG